MEIVHYNIPTSCSLQHTWQLFTITYPQVVHFNTPASGSLYSIPTGDYAITANGHVAYHTHTQTYIYNVKQHERHATGSRSRKRVVCPWVIEAEPLRDATTREVTG